MVESDNLRDDNTMRMLFAYLITKATDTHTEYIIQGGSDMTGTDCDLFTHKLSRSYLNHLVLISSSGYVYNTLSVL
jgi:hypothetical protein